MHEKFKKNYVTMQSNIKTDIFFFNFVLKTIRIVYGLEVKTIN